MGMDCLLTKDSTSTKICERIVEIGDGGPRRAPDREPDSDGLMTKEALWRGVLKRVARECGDDHPVYREAWSPGDRERPVLDTRRGSVGGPERL